MIYNIKESEFKKMLFECILESISEGTNMHSLYHFTNINGLIGILKNGTINANSHQTHIRNGKNYVSFTRHKSASEGFSLPNDSTVRIEVDGIALSNVKNSEINSFEFYSPIRTQKTLAKNSKIFGTPKLSAKQKYANAKSPSEFYNFDTQEYMNQAEESFETYEDSINAIKIVKRIDIFTTDKNVIKDILRTNSPLLSKIFIYTDFNNFSLQTDKCKSLNNFLRKWWQRKAAE